MPEPDDLPTLPKHIASKVLEGGNSLEDFAVEELLDEDEDGDGDRNQNENENEKTEEEDEISPALSISSRPRTRTGSFTKTFGGRKDWKVQLAKYIQLPKQDCLRIDISNDSIIKEELHIESYDSLSQLDDVADMHFINISALYVAYVYICSVQKIFENRIKNGSISILYNALSFFCLSLYEFFFFSIFKIKITFKYHIIM